MTDLIHRKLLLLLLLLLPSISYLIERTARRRRRFLCTLKQITNILHAIVGPLWAASSLLCRCCSCCLYFHPVISIFLRLIR